VCAAPGDQPNWQEAQVHFIGIDPHKDTLAACAVDQHGRPVAHASFPNDPAGYADLEQLRPG
jgi:hypothetical protein